MRRRELLAGLGGLVLAPGLAKMSGQVHTMAAQDSTPTVGPDVGNLAAMLALAPDVLAGASAPVAQIASYANPALQLATLGEPPGGRDFSAWANATYWMTLPSGIMEFAREPRWRQTFGFEARQIDQALEIGEPPLRVKLLRGRFDQEELRSAWTANGFSPIELAGAEAYSWAAEPEFDVGSDVSQFGVGNYDNAAILPDGTLVFTGYLTALEEAVGVARGEFPALGARPEVATIAGLLHPTWAMGYFLTAESVRSSAIGDNSGRASDGEASEMASQVVEAEMPRPELLAVGTTAGGPWPQPLAEDATPRPLPPGTPQSASEIAVLFSDRRLAEATAPIVDPRLTEGVTTHERISYREFFPSWEVRLDATLPALVIRLDTSPEDRPGRVLEMLKRHHLTFLAWID